MYFLSDICDTKGRADEEIGPNYFSRFAEDTEESQRGTEIFQAKRYYYISRFTEDTE